MIGNCGSKDMFHLLAMVSGQSETTLMRKSRIHLSVGIPTMGRKEILSAALPRIACQTRQPDEVVICVTSETDFEWASIAAMPFPVRVLISEPGSCRQRNHIIDNSTSDVIVFLDDDFLMEPSYLAHTEELFLDNPDIVIATGRVLADGILGPGISVSDGERLLETGKDIDMSQLTGFRPIYNAYGCNMAVRMAAVRQGNIRFDENLPLYGWLEDVDFSRLAAAFGQIVSADGLQGVHLGIKVARSPGVRLGYSQVANPIYLMRKHTMSSRHAVSQMGRNILANFVRMWRPEPWVDRRGRLKGNMRAIVDLSLGRLTPSNVTKL